MAVIEARWTGSYPNLCSGKWELFVDGRDVSKNIPEERRHSPMDTERTYRKWYFGGESGWEEQWETYEDGLNEEDWIAENNSWLSAITDDADTKSQIFEAIRACDWRHGECGGCI